MSQQYGSTPPGEPDPANSTADELEARGEDARDQAEQILRESEERTEENATVDPDDHSVIRRRTEETAESDAEGSTMG